MTKKNEVQSSHVVVKMDAYFNEVRDIVANWPSWKREALGRHTNVALSSQVSTFVKRKKGGSTASSKKRG